MSKKLMFVMICHNDIGHIKRSIETVIRSIVGKYEDKVGILFVDDCSDDGSFEFATTLLDGVGSAVRTPENMNVGGARNFGIDHLNSLPQDLRPEYIWFHDSDDYISDDGLERVMNTLERNPGVDILTIPIATLKYGALHELELYQSAVSQTCLENAANSPVGAWSKVFKLSKWVPNAPYQMCEHVAWHYELFDQMDSWAKVEGETPCYVWDRTNDKAISETVDFCNANSNTIEGLAFSDILVHRGLKDKWVSDNLRNIANMYDVRHRIKKHWVRECWAIRFRNECASMMSGHHVH